jgi:hypothetical protein
LTDHSHGKDDDGSHLMKVGFMKRKVFHFGPRKKLTHFRAPRKEDQVKGITSS